jgi:hypothetical protein
MLFLARKPDIAQHFGEFVAPIGWTILADRIRSTERTEGSPSESDFSQYLHGRVKKPALMGWSRVCDA